MSQRYKDLSLTQFRAFCETTRLGSLSAAAASLGLAQPTVWKLVHALEKHLGRPLFEIDTRGCRPTAAGRMLYPLASACLTNAEVIPGRLRELLDAAEVRVTVAGSPRQLGEDLMPCVAAFVGRRPQVRFSFLEMDTDEVAGAVDDGHAHVGFSPVPVDRKKYPRLRSDPWYPLDVLLVLRTDHPLARRRHVRLADLAPYPVLFPRANLDDFPNRSALAALRFDERSPQWVEARQASVLRRAVLNGLGSLLVLGRFGDQGHPDLTERDMSAELGTPTIFLLRQAGVEHHPAVGEFTELVREMLTGGRQPARARRARGRTRSAGRGS